MDAAAERHDEGLAVTYGHGPEVARLLREWLPTAWDQIHQDEAEKRLKEKETDDRLDDE